MSPCGSGGDLQNGSGASIAICSTRRQEATHKRASRNSSEPALRYTQADKETDRQSMMVWQVWLSVGVSAEDGP